MTWEYIDIRGMTDAEFDSWYAMADQERRDKCDACRLGEDRLRSIAGDHLARMGIARRRGVDPAEIRFARTSRGKPCAVGLDIHFNISHSGHLVVCAVSDDPIGIDVEQIRPVRRNLAEKICTPAELEWVTCGDCSARMLTDDAAVRFFQVWTSKEAYFKWTGTGITDLKSVDTLDHIHGGGTFELDGHIISIHTA